jgi:hypothetical protein
MSDGAFHYDENGNVVPLKPDEPVKTVVEFVDRSGLRELAGVCWCCADELCGVLGFGLARLHRRLL